MKKFSECNIVPKGKFVGDKIKISKILNKEIELHDFKIVDSKFEKDGKRTQCLYLQIKQEDDFSVVFTGSKNLIEMIMKVPKKDFPIRKQRDRLFRL